MDEAGSVKLRELTRSAVNGRAGPGFQQSHLDSRSEVVGQQWRGCGRVGRVTMRGAGPRRRRMPHGRHLGGVQGLATGAS